MRNSIFRINKIRQKCADKYCMCLRRVLIDQIGLLLPKCISHRFDVFVLTCFRFFKRSMACRRFSAISSDVHFLVCVDEKSARKKCKRQRIISMVTTQH